MDLPIVEDTIVYPTMVRLAGCLKKELDAAGLTDMCFVGVVPGGQTAIDVTCGGQGWVRLTQVFPSTTFPQPDNEATCTSLLAYELEVGVSLPIPVMDSRGNPPTVDAQLKAVQEQMAAMAAARRAIACCMLPDQSFLLGVYTPMENSGGAGGGTWSVLVHQMF